MDKLASSWVQIVRDCRDVPSADGKLGVIEAREYVGEIDGEVLTTPRIRLIDGTVIYGYECWWKRIGE